MASEEIGELAKRRGFFFGSNGAYGGTAGFYTFGPQGAALKKNVEDAWRDRFTIREGNREIEAPTIMPEAVFEASGHLEGSTTCSSSVPSAASPTAPTTSSRRSQRSRTPRRCPGRKSRAHRRQRHRLPVLWHPACGRDGRGLQPHVRDRHRSRRRPARLPAAGDGTKVSSWSSRG